MKEVILYILQSCFLFIYCCGSLSCTFDPKDILMKSDIFQKSILYTPKFLIILKGHKKFILKMSHLKKLNVIFSIYVLKNLKSIQYLFYKIFFFVQILRIINSLYFHKIPNWYQEDLRKIGKLIV